MALVNNGKEIKKIINNILLTCLLVGCSSSDHYEKWQIPTEKLII